MSNKHDAVEAEIRKESDEVKADRALVHLQEFLGLKGRGFDEREVNAWADKLKREGYYD